MLALNDILPPSLEIIFALLTPEDELFPNARVQG